MFTVFVSIIMHKALIFFFPQKKKIKQNQSPRTVTNWTPSVFLQFQRGWCLAIQSVAERLTSPLVWRKLRVPSWETNWTHSFSHQSAVVTMAWSSASGAEVTPRQAQPRELLTTASNSTFPGLRKPWNCANSSSVRSPARRTEAQPRNLTLFEYSDWWGVLFWLLASELSSANTW